MMGSRYIALIACLLLRLPLQAQREFANPFFMESHFFSSDFEQNIFQRLETKVDTDPLSLFLTFPATAGAKADNFRMELSRFCLDLKEKKHRNELTYLRNIFSSVQLRYLKKYQRYATFDRLSIDGSYDCLTGTALYAIVLQQLGIAFAIHETSAHSYLLVYSESGPVMFETTDPLQGFITSDQQIQEREERYSREMVEDLKNLDGMTGFRTQPMSMRTFNEVISIKQLAGLHYFNQAVIQYNLGNYRPAVNMLEKAYTAYPCRRILGLLLASVQQVLKEPGISRQELRLYSGKTSYYTKDSEKYFN